MNTASLKARLWTLLQPIIGEAVIWADQNAPRPAMPYCTLKLNTIKRKGTPYYASPDSNGLQDVLTMREATLQVQRFGDGSVEALETVSDKLALNSNLDKFSLQDISAYDVSSVTDVALLLNSLATEPRASVDVSVRWWADVSDNVGLIETVISDGTLGPEKTAKDLEYSISTVSVG